MRFPPRITRIGGEQSGPYPYSQDGSVFQNREGVLPKQSSG
ncbi:hypothetical protein ACFYWX_02765 [Streptomyces sp. NPDC002888]